jgi:RNA polymerase sigma factor (TIGR02999 family)
MFGDMRSEVPQSVTYWLQRWRTGTDGALDELTRLVYDDLRRLAARQLRSENPGHTLQATALVHELYLRLSSVRDLDWKGRGQFVYVAAQMMRRILTDHARRRLAGKRLSGAPPRLDSPDRVDVLAVDRALDKLALDFPRHARVVELRFFGGLESPEVAQVLDLSLRTVERDWQFAKGWLKHEIAGF